MEEIEDAELFADELTFANPYKSKVILDRAYHETDPATVASQQSHMSKAEQQQFQAVLNKYPNVFNGELGGTFLSGLQLVWIRFLNPYLVLGSKHMFDSVLVELEKVLVNPLLSYLL